MAESLTEFFNRKGAIALLALMNKTGATFEELVEDLPVARGTVDRRLKEAQSLGLVRKETIHGDITDTSAPPRYYFPTKRGMALYYQIDDNDLTMLLWLLQEYQTRFDKQAELFRAHVEAEEERYMDMPSTIDNGMLDEGLFDSDDSE